MRTEVKIGIAVIVVLAAAAIAYFVVIPAFKTTSPAKDEVVKVDENQHGDADYYTTTVPSDSAATTEPDISISDEPASDDSAFLSTTAPVDSGSDVRGDGVLEPGTESVPEEYTVKSGDNYWKIAREVFKDGSKASLIQAANPGTPPNRLRVGQKIKIPALSREEASPTDGGGFVSSAVDESVYIVKKGDGSLWNIAKSLYGDGSKYTEIVKANPGIKVNALRVGQKLNLPKDLKASTSISSGESSEGTSPRTSPKKSTGRTDGATEAPYMDLSR